MAEYTLTGASDWPMLVGGIKILGFVIVGLLGLIASLISALWLDFRKTLNDFKANSVRNCQNQMDKVDAELKDIWNHIDELNRNNIGINRK